MIVQTLFTTQAMLSAPRRSPAVPNHDGSRALFTQWTYTEGEPELKELVVMEIPSGSAFQIYRNNRIHDASWLGDGTNTVVYLEDEEDNGTRLMALDADHPFDEPKHISDIPASVDGLKVAGLGDGTIALAVLGPVSNDGKLRDCTTSSQASGINVFRHASELRVGCSTCERANFAASMRANSRTK